MGYRGNSRGAFDDAAIQTGALEVSPFEIDQALLSHPDVDRAVAFPIADAKFGSVVAGAVVLRPGASIRARDLKWFLCTHLPSYKVPQRLVLVDSIPCVPRRALARALGFTSSVRPSSVFAIQPNGEGAPLYVVGVTNRSWIQCDRPVFGIRQPDLTRLPPPHTVEHVAAECVHALRRFQSDGPYALAASEAGRTVALEMARQIEQTGERVDFVALFNSGGGQRDHLRYDRRHSWAGRTVDADLVRI